MPRINESRFQSHRKEFTHKIKSIPLNSKCETVSSAKLINMCASSLLLLVMRSLFSIFHRRPSRYFCLNFVSATDQFCCAFTCFFSLASSETLLYLISPKILLLNLLLQSVLSCGLESIDNFLLACVHNCLC